MKAWDIVGYSYKAETLCQGCILDKVSKARELFNISEYIDTEGALNAAAAMQHVDREDEKSYDSGDFPKVVFASQVESDGERCDSCGESLLGVWERLL
jgi:hypothetical protein